mgnify:FL=1
MKKLKIVLLFSILLIRIPMISVSSNYSNETEIYGIITDYKIDGNQLTMQIKAKEKIIVTYYFNSETEKKYYQKNLNLGFEILCQGTLMKPDDNRNFYLFNYRKYLMSKKIYWKFQANKLKYYPRKNLLYLIKNHLLETIEKRSNSEYLKLFILGQNTLDEEIKKSYQYNGISHLFAISGMHIVILTFALTKLFQRIFKNESIVFMIIIFTLWFYLFLTNYTISVLRAVLFYFIFSIKKIFSFSISNVILAVFILLLLLNINPYYIYDVGFLYSFTISIGLIYFKELLREENYFKSLIKTSTISFLIGLPITIYVANQINFLSPIFNLLFVPIVSLVIFPISVLSLVIPFLIPIDNFLINLLENLSLLCSKINLFTFSFQTVPIIILIIYELLIFMMISFKNKLLFFFLMVILIIHHCWNLLNPYTRVTMLDVGQGDSILIQFAHNKGNILIDTGGIPTYSKEIWKIKKHEYSIVNSITIPYLKSIGVHKLNYLIITHGDYDHMGEAIHLVENFKIENVILNCGSYNELEQKLIDTLDKKTISYYSCIKELDIDKSQLQFLYTKEYDNENDNSNVIYFNYNNYKFLFMGDAGVDKETDILEKYTLSNIDFLKVGHHGSDTSSNKGFIDSIQPKYSLISVGKNNRYGHPKEIVLKNLDSTKIYRTDQDGAIEIKLNKKEYQIKTCHS